MRQVFAVFAIAVALGWTAQASAQFPCDSTVYIVQGPQLNEIDPSTDPVTLDPIGPPHSANFNAIGYNFIDGLIYGYDLTANQFMQMDETGSVTFLGDAGIPGFYIAGDVDPSGNYYVPQWGGTTLYRLDLNVLPGPLTAEAIALDGPVPLADFAYSPRTGLLYGTGGGNLLIIDPNAGPGTGTITTIPITGSTAAGATTGAAWFDPFGDLYVYNNSGTVYRVNTTTAEAERISGGPNVSNNDGTRCSVGVDLRKGVSSPEVQPGDTVTFTILIANTGDPISPNVIVDLADSLPAGFTYVPGTIAVSGDVSSGTPAVTSDTLDIADIEIAPNTTVTITIDAVVSGTVDPGTYPSQAEISNVPPSAGGPTVLSTPMDGVGPGPTIVAIPPPDLIVETVDTGALTHNAQTGEVTGTAEVTIRNAGFGASSNDIEVTLFADVDGDGAYTPGTDTVLGTDMVAGGLLLDETSTMSFDMPPGATLDFPNQPIFAFVDSAEVTDEVVEANNVGSSATSCEPFPAASSISPVLEWRFDDVVTAGSSPMVADMTQDGVPDVIYVDWDPVSAPPSGVLRVVDGVTHDEVWASATLVDPAVTPAVADIDGDGLPEVVAITPLNFATLTAEMVAFEHDGTDKWTGDNAFIILPDFGGFGLGITDLDADGNVEVFYGAQAFDGATGAREWAAPGFLISAVSVAMDVTRDGVPELVANGVFYDASGTQVGAVFAPNGVAFGNFNTNTTLEFFGAAGANQLFIFNEFGVGLDTGTLPVGAYRAPLVVDLNGDGAAETVVSGATELTAFNGDGTELWSTATGGTAAHRATPTAFDLDGDGSFEILTVTETEFLIFNAAGNEIFSMPWEWSPAGYAGPIVADVDADGVAEVVLTGGTGGDPTNIGGVHVLGPAGGDWAPARTVWNQHPYYQDNVEWDSSIPTSIGLPWRTHNTFRVQASACWDLAAARFSVDTGGDPGSVALGARVGNGGTEPLPIGTPVAFYDGDPNAGGTLIGVATTNGIIAPGEFEEVSFTWTTPPAAGASPFVQDVYVVVDDDGAGSAVREPDEDNNTISGSFEVADRDGDGAIDVGDPDDDNDGVLDADEGAATGLDPSGDHDVDGTPNYRDPDVPGFTDDNDDGIDDRDDADLDGIPNHLDLDSDNDGIPDLIENVGGGLADALDADRDGLADDPTDADMDGVVDVLEGIPLRASDPDGIPDILDLDADGDGIYDIIEADGTDSDDDGRVDSFTDADGDGHAAIVDPDESGTPWVTPDTDLDGAFDFQDVDSDNDRVRDATEGHDVNADGLPDVVPSGMDSDGNGVDDAYDTNGTVAPVPDHDRDGVPDYRDTDDDGDLIPTYNGTAGDEDLNGDTDPTNDDSDGDGVPEYLDTTDGPDNDYDGVADDDDPDDDNDGVLDVDEGPGDLDTDGDGVPNRFDLDSDNDGIPDLVEQAGGENADTLDANRDGVLDVFSDMDMDGLQDVFDAAPNDAGDTSTIEPVRDTDGDGPPDVLDLDADGDGIYDIVEADGTDTDGDGVVDNFADGDDDGLATTVDPSEGGTPWDTPDTDGDIAFDFQDVDSDNDRVPDSTEGHDVNADGQPDVVPTGQDTDDNGVDDAYDTNGTTAPLPDRDGDGTPDYRDTDDDGDSIPTFDGTSDDEDHNGDMDPTNDDLDGDGIPSYLDDDEQVGGPGGVSGGSLGCAVQRGAGPSSGWLWFALAVLAIRRRRA